MATKRIKSEVEKQLIVRLWNQRKRYNEAKADFDDLCSWVDGERMRKAENEIKHIRKELRKVRIKSYRTAA